jgi:hypothetical protein
MELKEVEMRLQVLEKQVGEILKHTAVLPRIEERMIRQRDELRDHEQRLRTLEQGQQKSNVYVGWMERIVWVVIAGLISSIAFFR